MTLEARDLTRTPIQDDEDHSWQAACTHTECSLHQISPYIGKLKSVIAGSLIERYSSPGDLVLDPFAGSFTVPLEASLRGRRAMGADVSPYAIVLGRAKLFRPSSLTEALVRAEALLSEATSLPAPDLRKVPEWVRAFFHPQTLKEAIRFADLCIERQEDFFLACFLGILHHQRPGFLSYPSSHLVPYLRDKKYPRAEFPEMYDYRGLRERLLRKIERVYKRVPMQDRPESMVRTNDIRSLRFPKEANCIITSPPYMNALDYGRDNRLRLWFITRTQSNAVDSAGSDKRLGFAELMQILAKKGTACLLPGGYCVVIVGDQSLRGYRGSPAETVLEIFATDAPQMRLTESAVEQIPDIRRARRDCRGVRLEHFLVFRKEK